MKCSKAKSKIPLLVGGDLRPHKAEAVQKHLLTCTACARDFQQTQEALSALSAAHLETLPDEAWLGFNTRVKVAVEHEPAPTLGWWHTWMPQGMALRALLGGAVVLAILAGSGILFGPAETDTRQKQIATGPESTPEIVTATKDEDAGFDYEAYVDQLPYALEEVTVLAGHGDI